MTPECGTYAGYQRHTRKKEPHCDACKAANAAYRREWRATHPDIEKPSQRATSRALWLTAQDHIETYRKHYADELGKEREAS